MKQHYTIISYILLVGILFLLGVMTEQITTAKTQCPVNAAYGDSVQNSSAENVIEFTHNVSQAESLPVFTSSELAGGNQ
jgi:hypothetical protein